METPHTSHNKIDAAIAGPLLMLSAALLFTLLNVTIKSLPPSFRVWDIGFYRFFGGLVMILIIFGRYGNPFRANDVRLLVIRGCTGSVAFVCLVTALRMLPISTAMVLFYAFPAFSALFSFFLYRETLSKVHLLCIAGVMIGVGVLFDFQMEGGLLGQIMAIIGAAFAGLTVTLIRELRQKKRLRGDLFVFLYDGITGHTAQIRATAGSADHARRVGHGPGYCVLLINRSTADEPGLFLLPGLGGRRVHVQRGDFHRTCRDSFFPGSGYLAILDRRPADFDLRGCHEPASGRDAANREDGN